MMIIVVGFLIILIAFQIFCIGVAMYTIIVEVIDKVKAKREKLEVSRLRMRKYKTICDTALTEIYNIEELSDIANTVIGKLINWTYSDRMYREQALKVLSDIAERLNEYDRSGRMMIKTLEINEATTRVMAETSCCICEGSIPIYSMYDKPDRLCKECKKRLKELLYPTEDTRGEK